MGGSFSLSGKQIEAVEAAVATQKGCSLIATEMQHMVKTGDAPQEIVQQMKHLESVTALTNLSKISKRPYVDCIIVCSYDQDSERVFPIHKDDSDKQLVIRVCKINNQSVEKNSSLHIFLKSGNRYTRYETNVPLGAGDIVNFVNSLYNIDSIITFDITPQNYTFQVKTEGGYFIDVYSCKYTVKETERYKKSIDPTDPISQDICAGFHLRNDGDGEKHNEQYAFKYCPISGAICREQCLVCGKTGVNKEPDMPVNRSDHVDRSDDSNNISNIFERDYHWQYDEESGKQSEFYKFGCSIDFNIDSIENMNECEIVFGDYFKLINVKDGNNSGFSAIEAFRLINSYIKYDNVIGSEEENSKFMLKYNSDEGEKSSEITDGLLFRTRVSAAATAAMSEDDIAKLSNNHNINIILFDFNDDVIKVNNIDVKINKGFIFLVRKTDKSGDSSYNLLIPNSQKMYNQFCVDAWANESLFDFGNLDPNDAVEKRKKYKNTATKLQAATRGMLARKDYQKQKKMITAVQAAARGIAARKSYQQTKRAAQMIQAAARKRAATKATQAATRTIQINHIADNIVSLGSIDYNTVLQRFGSYYERAEGEEKEILETILGKHTTEDFETGSECDNIIRANIGDGPYNNNSIKELLTKLQTNDEFKRCGSITIKLIKGIASQIKDKIRGDLTFANIKTQLIMYFTRDYPRESTNEKIKKLFSPIDGSDLGKKGQKGEKGRESGRCRDAFNRIYSKYRDQYRDQHPDQPVNVNTIVNILVALSKDTGFTNCNAPPTPVASGTPRTSVASRTPRRRKRRGRRGGSLSHHNEIEFAKYNVSVTKEVLRRAKIRLSQAKRLKKNTTILEKRVILAKRAHKQTEKELNKLL